MTDNRFRFQVQRSIGHSGKKGLIIMIFPSDGDQDNDDNTIRIAMAFAKRWKFGHLYIANLYAYRAGKYENIKKLTKQGFDFKKEENKNTIAKLIQKVDQVVYAWGKGQKEPKWLRQINYKQPYCLEITKTYPLHISRKSSKLKLKQFERNEKSSELD